MQRDFKGVWIPKEIYLHKELTPTDKLLLAEINSFSTNGVCFASNEHFAEFLNISKNHVSKLVTKLARMGFIKVNIKYKENSKEVEKRIITPNHSGVDPIIIEDDTPNHSGINPVLLDDYKKEQKENTNKKQEKKKKTKQKNSASADLESEFETLWKKYPRKLGRSKALQYYIKARKTKKYTYEDIENGLNKYIDYLNFKQIEEQFIMHGSTWFNQEKWLDEYICAAPQTKPKNVFEFLQKEFGGQENDIRRSGEVIDYNPRMLP